MTAALQDLARAKINLYLHVTGRRADGYHTLDSLAVFAAAADTLMLAPSPGDADGQVRFSISGQFGAGLVADADDNLVVRAARALQAAAPGRRFAPVSIDLQKMLPVASGIGGGSADAACALRLLARAWDLDVDLAPIAASLGADVPVCLSQAPARMGGIGEILTPAPVLPPCAMLLVNCGAAVPTPAVFRARAASGAPFRAEAVLPGGWTDLASMVADLEQTMNDLEPAAIALCPAIANVLEAIAAEPGCAFARMSGSGATCFGLFADATQAGQAAQRLNDAHGWWTSAGAIGHSSASHGAA